MCTWVKTGMTQNNVKIAITGGICSGKSTVANIIREQGHKVISCDEIYSALLQDRGFLKQICDEFGKVLTNEGALDRVKLSEIVFNDHEKLNKLNIITHPQIMQRAMEQMQGVGIHFCEVPLLFECGFENLFDNVIVVLRSENDRVKELMRRTKINKEQAVLRVKAQFDYHNKDFIKYYVIHNDKNLSDLYKQTLNLLEVIDKDYN